MANVDPKKVAFIRDLYPAAVEVERKTGMSHETILAQAAQETGWGQKVLPGTNNIFNIKAAGADNWQGAVKTFTVPEYKNGRTVMEQASFRVYGSIQEALEDRVKFLQANQRYARAGLFDEGTKGNLHNEAAALQRAGYATDPNYASALEEIMRGRTMRAGVDAGKQVLEQQGISQPQPSGASVAQDTVQTNTMSRTILRNGHRGDEVKALQDQLNSLGYKIGSDGIFGKETERAIRDFQEKNGLGVDGKAGPNTFSKLEAQLQNKPELAEQNKGIAEKEGTAFSSAYERTLQFDSVTYKMGGKDPAKGSIDCSGWVTYLQNNSMDDINKLLGQEVFTQKDRFNPLMEGASETIKRASEQSGILIEGKQITRDILKEGMVIGEDNGDKGFDRGRFRGIDHITMVVRDPNSGELMISQSSSGKGVHLQTVDSYLAQKDRSGTKLFLTDPLAKARDLLQERNKENTIEQKTEKAQPEKADKEKIQSPESQKFLDQVKKAVADLYDKNKLPHADKLDNVCCALVEKGIAKKMTGVDYAMEKKGDISILHTPKGKMVPTHATVNIEIAAKTPTSISISAINANDIKINVNSVEEHNKQIQQQEINQQPARSMGM